MKISEIKRVVTHPAPHHPDEVLSIAILKALGGVFEISERTHVGELFSDEIAVDIGRQHNPEKGYFDHHQGGVEGSSLDLILEHFAPELLENKDFANYVGLKSEQDTQGLRPLGERNNRDDLNGLLWLERRLVNLPIDQSVEIFELLVKQELEEISARAEIKKSLSYKRIGYGLMEEANGLSNEFIKKFVRLKNNISQEMLDGDPGVFIVSPSVRNAGGWTIISRSTEKLNLNDVEGLAGHCQFLHKGGFLGELVEGGDPQVVIDIINKHLEKVTK